MTRRFDLRSPEAQAESARQVREPWKRRIFTLLSVLAVVLDQEEATPSREIVALVPQRMTDTTGKWDHDRRVMDALRRLRDMGLVESEQRQYENVTRWFGTDEGLTLAAEAGEVMACHRRPDDRDRG